MHTQHTQDHPWLSILVLMLAVLLPGSAWSADATPERPLEKITIAYSSVSGNMAPLWITHERGFFRKYGLDVQLVFIESGSTTVQSLISKDVAFAQMAGAGVVQSHLRGSDVVMIAGVINTLTFKFYVDKNIKQPEQLRGKSLAVTRFGSSTDFALRYALERYGLAPEKDVAILQSGSMPAIFASLEAGKIQGAMLSAPFTLRAKNMGFPLMADLQMLGLEYQHTGLATTQAVIKSRPDLVRNVMKAYAEGIHYYKTQRAESLTILAKYLKTADAEVLKAVYEDIGLTLTPRKPYPTLRGIELMLRELAVRNPKHKAARPEEFVDLTFIKELDSSGFIDRLYKTQPVVASREETRSPVPSLVSKEKPAPVKQSASTVRGGSDLPQTYTVLAGDTLSHLAVRFYGSSSKWPQIHQANANTLKNPHYLYIGQQLLIPPDGGRGA
jgi:ABC-type nitrate/sulfonate/bicarbonate transport system substrate-binding protein/LysM repeat protein